MPDDETQELIRRMYNTQVEQHESRGVKIRAKIKRGTETRDQDELLLEVKDPNPAVAMDKFADAVQALEVHAESIREIQPGETDE